LDFQNFFPKEDVEADSNSQRSPYRDRKWIGRDVLSNIIHLIRIHGSMEEAEYIDWACVISLR